jgi:Na+(H+)/acetate symporter ActP
MTRSALLVAGLALVTAPAHGHDIYANVKNKFGFSCCNGQIVGQRPIVRPQAASKC